MALGSNVIKVVITGDSHGFDAAADKTAAKADGMGSKMKKVYAAVAGAAIAGLALAVDAGMKLQESQDRLRQALANSGESWAQASKAVDAAVKSNEKYGTTASQTEDLLARGVASTGKLSTATRLLKLSQDIAAGSGKDLQSVYLAVTKASEGQLRPLKQLGIDLPVAAGGALKVKVAYEALLKAQAALSDVEQKIHDGHLKGAAAADTLAKAEQKVSDAQTKLSDAQNAGKTILDALSAKFKGQADVAAESLSGKMKALRAEVTDFAAQIGLKLIPYLTAAITWLDKNKSAMAALAITIGAVAVILTAYAVGVKVVQAAQIAWTAACKIATAAQWLFNAAMDANPVLLVVLAIAALAAGVIYAYTHFKWFRAAVQDVWAALKVAFEWVKAHWQLMLAILVGPVGIAALLIIQHFKQIEAVFRGTVAVILSIVRVFTATFRALWNTFGAAIVKVAQGYWTIIQGVFKVAAAVLIGIIRVFAALFTGNWSALWNAVTDTASSVWNGIKGIVGGALTYLEGILGLAWAAIVAGAKVEWGVLLSFFESVPGKVTSIFTGLIGMMYNIGVDLIQAVINGVESMLSSLGSAFSNVIHSAVSSVPGGAAVAHFFHVPGFATGGVVPGPVGTPSLIMAHGGEAVLTPAQMHDLLLSRPARDSSRTIVNNYRPADDRPSIVNNFPAGISAAAVIRAQRQHDRINGVSAA